MWQGLKLSWEKEKSTGGKKKTKIAGLNVRKYNIIFGCSCCYCCCYAGVADGQIKVQNANVVGSDGSGLAWSTWLWSGLVWSAH